MHDAATMPAAEPIDSVGPPPQRMQCMEVWGGNQMVNHGVVMAGLDAWLYSKPYGGAAGGGDVHYVSSCASGRVTRLLLADVSGHGEKVANTAAKLRAMMYQNVNYLDQTRFVRTMNHEFGELSKEGRFATAIVTTFFAPTNDLTVCNAGHPAPLLYRASTGQWSVLEAQAAGRLSPGGSSTGPSSQAAADRGVASPANLPLGVVDLTSYEQFGMRLKVGDFVLCYTDSLIESHDADGTMLGVRGLLQIVATIDMSEPSQIIGAVLDAIAARAEGNLTEDDVTLLLFRPNGLAPRLTIGQRVLAPLRIGATLVKSLRPGARPMPWPELSLPNIGGAMFHSFNRLWSRRNQTEPASSTDK